MCQNFETCYSIVSTLARYRTKWHMVLLFFILFSLSYLATLFLFFFPLSSVILPQTFELDLSTHLFFHSFFFSLLLLFSLLFSLAAPPDADQCCCGFFFFFFDRWVRQWVCLDGDGQIDWVLGANSVVGGLACGWIDGG